MKKESNIPPVLANKPILTLLHRPCTLLSLTLSD